MNMEEIDTTKLDFSEFHDLMHPWFSEYCRAQPGGIKRHLSLWWTYIAQDKYIYGPIHDIFKRHTAAELEDRERTEKGWRFTGTGRYICFYCAVDVDKNGKEIRNGS